MRVRNTSSARHRVEIVAFDGVQLLDVAGPLQVFTSCNDLLRERGEARAYDVLVVSEAGATVTSSAGLSIETAPLSDMSCRVDTVMVAGGFGVHQAAARPILREWIVARSRRARRTASVCTGAFLLAAAGTLDGRRATTHWAHATRLAAEHPSIEVDAEPIFIEDQRIWTSAGVTAGIDMTLALVERDCGRALSLAVARRLVVYHRRPGGQGQFSDALAAQSATRFGTLLEWMRANPASDLSVPALAARTHMSERSFARRFVAEIGETPARMAERVRVNAARRGLEGTSPIEQVARHCGFGSAETMRRAFRRTLGVGPKDYRAQWADGQECSSKPIAIDRVADRRHRARGKQAQNHMSTTYR